MIKKEKNTTIYVRGVPVQVKTKFKAYCAKHGLTMTQAIIQLMKQSGKRKP